MGTFARIVLGREHVVIGVANAGMVDGEVELATLSSRQGGAIFRLAILLKPLRFRVPERHSHHSILGSVLLDPRLFLVVVRIAKKSFFQSDRSNLLLTGEYNLDDNFFSHVTISRARAALSNSGGTSAVGVLR